MKTPHFLKQLKYKFDFVSRYSRRFGLGWALTNMRATRPDSGVVGPFQIIHPSLPVPLHVRTNTSDIEAFEKIFVWDQYNGPLTGEIRTIIDCGGNIGLSALWFAIRFPKSQIIVIEPDSANFELLLANTRAFPNITALKAGVWSESGSLRIANPSARPDSFYCELCPQGTAGSFIAVDIASLVAKNNWSSIDLIKIDIEGGEKEILARNTGTWLPMAKNIVIEFHGAETERVGFQALPLSAYSHILIGENHFFNKLGK